MKEITDTPVCLSSGLGIKQKIFFPPKKNLQCHCMFVLSCSNGSTSNKTEASGAPLSQLTVKNHFFFYLPDDNSGILGPALLELCSDRLKKGLWVKPVKLQSKARVTSINRRLSEAFLTQN